MRRVDLERREFLEWAAAEHSGAKWSPRVGSKAAEISLVWPSDADGPIIAVDSRDLREFLAFTTTYLASFSPFTAFYRTVARELLPYLPNESSEIPRSVRRALLGAVVGDAANHTRQQEVKLSDLSIQACLAAPAATAFAGYLSGYQSDLILSALERWQFVRQELGTSPQSLRGGASTFWQPVLAALDIRGEEPLSEEVGFVRAVLHGEMDAANFVLRKWLPQTRNLEAVLRGTRESRVQLLEEILGGMAESRLSTTTQELIAGYVVAQIAEGSFSYLPLATRVNRELPNVQIWFGFFAGLNEYSDIMSAGECLGRRLDREFAQHRGVRSRISADLSYEEFMLLG